MAGPLADKQRFGQSILLLATALGFDLDEAVIGVYWHALKGLPSEVWREAFMQAADRTWFKFPKPAELKALAAQMMESKRRAAFHEAIKFCDHTSQFEEVNGKMQRCSCWTRGMQAMEAVGQPVALPPWTDREVGE